MTFDENKFRPLIPELLVSDIARSLNFYTDILGFKTLYERPEEGFAFLDREGAQLMLERYVPGHERTWASGRLAHLLAGGSIFRSLRPTCRRSTRPA